MRTKLIAILSSSTGPFRTTARLLAIIAVVLVWTLPGAPQLLAQVPPPPSNLTATAVSASQINLQWVNNPPLGTEIRVFRSSDGINFMQIDTLNRTATTYSSTGLLASVAYSYQVKAHNLSGDSDPSNTAGDSTWPSLRLNDICPGQISVAWRSAGVDVHYDVQRCTKSDTTDCTQGADFTVIATVPAPGSGYADGGLADGTYFYRIQAVRTNGDSPLSNTVRATLGAGAGGVVIDHSGGFATHDDLKNNGTATFAGDIVRLTLNQNDQRGTIFSVDKVDVRAFTGTFTFRIHDTTATPADGLTFVIQNDNRGSSALGPGGGGLTFGPDNRNDPGCQNTDPVNGSIRNSVAIKFDIYNNLGEGDNSTGIFTDGRSPTLRCASAPADAPDVSIDLRGSQIELKNDHPKQVDLTYDGITLTETITDLVTMGTFTHDYTVDIPGIVGGDTAYVGFGGATGGLNAIQDLLTWTFGGPASPLPRAPGGLRVTNVSPSDAGSDVTIAWKCNNAQNAKGFKIERSDNGGDFAQINTVDVTQVNYTDQGLADGSYCYRARSFNDDGDSTGYSNVYCISLPVPASVDHSAGFDSHDDLKGNMNAFRPFFTQNLVRLTNGGFGQAGSVFTTGRVDITRFMNTFTFQIHTPGTNPMGEGMTFTVQGNAPTSLGNNGASLGYGGVSSSAAVKFGIFEHQGSTDNSTGLFTDGHVPTVPGAGSSDLNVPIGKTILDFKSGDLFQVDMVYDASTLTLTVTITDTVTENSASQSYAVDIPGQVGSSFAFVGLTAGTDGNPPDGGTATQDVQTWTFQSGLPVQRSKQ